LGVSLQKGIAQALVDTARLLPLPVTLEHSLRPLLLSLPEGPDVAIALIRLGSALGSACAAVHLLPALLAVLASWPSGAPFGSEMRSHSFPRTGGPRHGVLLMCCAQFLLNARNQP
jgi:hypothetical protein